MEMSGSVSDFNYAAQLAFKEGLASNIAPGVSPNDIDLIISAGSIRVVVVILAPGGNATAADALVAALNAAGADPRILSAWTGQTVFGISPVQVRSVLVNFPSPPPPSPGPSPPPPMPPPSPPPAPPTPPPPSPPSPPPLWPYIANLEELQNAATGLTGGRITLIILGLILLCVFVVFGAWWYRRQIHKRGKMRLPKADGWKSKKDGKRYACFLSHYKHDCAATARILHDQIAQMLKTPVFLDSAELTDLRQLFSTGLHQSDVLVLLCTPGVLTRPWCLLELWEAHRNGIPVLPLHIAPVPGAKGFDQDAMRALLTDLDTKLDDVTEGAWGIVWDHVDSTAPGTTPDEIKDALLEVTGLGQDTVAGGESEASRGRRSSSLEESLRRQTMTAGPLRWDPGAPDRLMVAATQQLIERMAQLTDRSIKWREKSTPHAVKPAGAAEKSRFVPRKLIKTAGEVSMAKTVGAKGKGKGQKALFFIACDVEHQGGADARLFKSVLEARLGKGTILGATESVKRQLSRAMSRAFDHVRHLEHDIGSAAHHLGEHLPGHHHHKRPPSPQGGISRRGMRGSLHKAVQIATGRGGHHHHHHDGRKTLHQSLEALGKAEALLLLLTQNVLEVPSVLLQVYEAIKKGMPIVVVRVEGGGYNFGAASHYLNHLETELGQKDASALEELKSHLANFEGETSLDEMQSQLASVIPSMIAVPFNPAAAKEKHTMAGLVDELMQRKQTITQHRRRSLAAKAAAAKEQEKAFQAEEKSLRMEMKSRRSDSDGRPSRAEWLKGLLTSRVSVRSTTRKGRCRPDRSTDTSDASSRATSRATSLGSVPESGSSSSLLLDPLGSDRLTSLPSELSALPESSASRRGEPPAEESVVQKRVTIVVHDAKADSMPLPSAQPRAVANASPDAMKQLGLSSPSGSMVGYDQIERPSVTPPAPAPAASVAAPAPAPAMPPVATDPTPPSAAPEPAQPPITSEQLEVEVQAESEGKAVLEELFLLSSRGPSVTQLPPGMPPALPARRGSSRGSIIDPVVAQAPMLGRAESWRDVVQTNSFRAMQSSFAQELAANTSSEDVQGALKRFMSGETVVRRGEDNGEA